MKNVVPTAAAEMRRADSDPIARLHLLDEAWEPAYDRLTALACDILSAPSAAVSIIDDEGSRQYFKSFHGLDGALADDRQTPLSQSLCNIVRDSGATLAIRDAASDTRFRTHPAHAELGIRAYLGQPIHLPCGTPIGALCALDMRPHDWSEDDICRLAALAGCVDDAIRRVAAAEDAIAGQSTARRAVAARNLFLAGLNHEVRTALNGVLGVAEALADLPLDDDARPLADEILRSGEDLHRLLETLLDRTDAATGGRPVMRQTGLREMLATVLGVLRLAPPGRAHSFTVEVDDRADPLGGLDEMRVKQVLYDLLGTAITAAPTGSSDIRVRVAARTGATIRVTLDADPRAETDLRTTLTALDFDPVRRLTATAGGAFEITLQGPLRAVFEASVPMART